MPLQCNSDHFVAFALLYISAQCLRYAIQGSAKPLRLNTNPCNTIAIQLISIHRHCGSNRLCSNPRLSQSSRILSPPYLCHSFPCHTKPLPCVTLQCFAFAVRFLALRLFAFAVQFRALHIIAIALHIYAVHCRCFASLRVLHSAIAFLRPTKQCAAIAIQR